ncbi:MAG: hypothetical protein JO176_13515, partial [Acidimicrobiia bacterium]|nr:hypothetical protein [Acidimicrobiia bacterium]
MAIAGADEVLVSERTKTLAAPVRLTFEDRGVHQLKGIDDERHLYALVSPRISPRVEG